MKQRRLLIIQSQIPRTLSAGKSAEDDRRKKMLRVRPVWD